ncbi:MAG: hypothetical protein ABIP55_07700 [Tepidisphaeraceae bacterium]
MIGYLTEYCQFHRLPKPGRREIPEASSFCLERIGELASFSKTSLLQGGLATKYVPNALVIYARPIALANHCGRRFRHRRAYGGSRDAPPFAR